MAPNTNVSQSATHSQSTLSETSEAMKQDATSTHSNKKLPETGDSIKQGGLLGGVMTLLIGLGLMKRKKKNDEDKEDDTQA